MRLWYCDVCKRVRDTETFENLPDTKCICGGQMNLRTFESILLNHLREINETLVSIEEKWVEHV